MMAGLAASPLDSSTITTAFKTNFIKVEISGENPLRQQVIPAGGSVDTLGHVMLYFLGLFGENVLKNPFSYSGRNAKI